MDLLQQTPLRADQKQFVQEVHHATWSLLSLFTDVLDYAKLQSDSVSLNSKAFLTEALVDDATASVLLLAEDKNLELIARISPQTPAQLIGDETRLRQIVVNLLSNALKFTSHGFVRLDVDYEAVATPPTLVIRVSDTGIGIKEDHQVSIFEAFSQVEAPDHRRQGGAGLGLAIVSRLVTLMNGSIRLASAEGLGSRFEIRIPIEAAKDGPGWLANYRQSVYSDVLLLARRSDNVTILQEYLTDIGLRVCYFEAPGQLLHAIRDHDPGSPLWGVIVETGFRECPPTVLAERLRIHSDARLIVADSLASTISLPAADKEACDAVLTWPLGGRFLSGLLQPREQRITPAMPGGLSVLVVDDNAVNRKIAMALLEGLGCEVELANHGRDAVQLASRQEYTLILMDCQMPEMDGYEAARLIRGRQRPGSKTRIYGTSADGEDETRERCRKAGMDGFVDKPIHVEKLRSLLQTAAGERV
jgi:CheY-like chemotaxis protein